MKKVIIYLLCLVLFNCEDKKTTSIKTEISTQTKVTKDTIEKVKPVEKQENEYPVLTDENAMDFFLEYDKLHKETKVRIVTEFGNIDILFI